ncbi:hypothetical protein KM176_00775 [Pseudooceanicola sp. CBS1P-1]|uniref:hypothetical protein n=1 Tax=Pseudooceanicola TaxID=1679449 RepID=UPI001925F510|nr:MULTISPECIES: hypothetical protein [Pseudooceanicola]MBT9382380.1 hypothetical protein [Pseudooceanicola endophyticus]
MLALAGLIIGALFGGLRARRRGGDRRDIWQYAIVHAMLFALVGLFLSILLTRALG